jgi:hypothetical protein
MKILSFCRKKWLSNAKSRTGDTQRQFDQIVHELLPHTASLETIFVQIYMDALPGVPGVSNNQNFSFTNKTVEFLR